MASLLIHGELPGKEESAAWADEITQHTFVHENVKKFIDGFHHDAHPMGILVSTIAALSTFYPGAKAISDNERRHEQIVRLIAKMPTLAAFAYRHAMGLPYAYPDDELSYAGNFLNMMRRMTEPRYNPDPVLSHALDVLFTLHAGLYVLGKRSLTPVVVAHGIYNVFGEPYLLMMAMAVMRH